MEKPLQITTRLIYNKAMPGVKVMMMGKGADPASPDRRTAMNPVPGSSQSRTHDYVSNTQSCPALYDLILKGAGVPIPCR